MTLILSRPVIAVAGSCGKTTTKEMIASILKQEWSIYKSPLNQNNRVDIKKHIRHIRPNHKTVVLEFGMSGRGNLTRSCKIIRPNMAIVTMVGTAHIGNVGGSLSRLIGAKSELIQHMKQNGILFLNADDTNSQSLNTRNFKGHIIKVGIQQQADYMASEVQYVQDGMTFKVVLNNCLHEFFIPTYGTHNVYNALFAIAVADSLGFRPDDIRSGLKNYDQPSRRLAISRLESGMTLIDDTFNASTSSVKAAMDVLTNISDDKNVAILGSLAELGNYSSRAHAEVGKYVATKDNLSQLFTFGKDARRIAREAIKAGFPSNRVLQFMDRNNLHRQLEKSLEPGSTILIKGSSVMHMSKTVRFLKQIL